MTCHLFPVRISSRLFRCVAFLLLSMIAGLTARAATLPAGFVEQSIGSGWNQPAGITYDTSGPNNRLYVWERGGMVWIVENGVKLSKPLIDISEEVMAWRDFGLLGVALDPQFQQNGYIYLLYVVDRHHLLYHGTATYDRLTSLFTAPTIGRLTRYTARASDEFRSVDPASRRVLIGESISKGFPIMHESHGVGSLVFGTDGSLLAACGDAASYNAMDDGGTDGGSKAPQAQAEGIITAKENVGAFRAQLIDSLAGKIIRIDPATGDAITSNPYFDPANPRSAKSRVWALGLRNPYRMTLRPGTGSHSRADGNPGTIYLGDVGWGTWEDIHVVNGPGKNCGWPLFEGLEAQGSYQNSPAVNLDAPNPLGGHFRFKDLLIQDTLATPVWPNPSNPAQQIPASIPKWVHTRPILDFRHGTTGPARTGIFSGTTAAVSALGSSDSPVAGPSFGGNAATGGTFFTTSDFPATYRGTFFFADYAAKWIKNMVIGPGDRPTEVRPFAASTGPVVFVSTHPTAGGLYYITFDGNVRRITYAPGGNQLPVAAASSTVNYGPSPLLVQFNGTGSYDPDGASLSYLWSFDDGTTSTEATPQKTFTAGGTRKFNVTLRVTDAGGAVSTAAVPIFVNHAPPSIAVTSPVDGTKYPVGEDATFPLTATIAPQPGQPVTTSWQTILHHDNHTHEDAPLAGPNASVTTGGEGAGFFYENVLTVTDALGLSVTRVVNLLPNLVNAPPTAGWSQSSKAVLVGETTILDSAASVSDGDSPGLEGGALRVELISGSTSESLALRNEGQGAGQISVSGNSVTYGGVVIGTLTITNSRSPLVVTFNTAATPAAAQALLRSVTYLSTVARTTPRTVRVTVADGDGGTSAPRDIAVTARTGNLPPLVQITNPSAGALFTAPAAVTIDASAVDPDGTVARVDFFRGNIKIGSATNAPYSFTWQNVPAGTYKLRARATDNSGAKAWSAAVQIRVTASTTNLLSDDFNDNVRTTTKWALGTVAGTITFGTAAVDSAIPVNERNQRLEIPLRANIEGDHYHGYLAVTARDFTNASAGVEIIQAAAGSADTMLALSLDARNLLLMVVEVGELYLDHIVNGSRNITGVVFNPTQHRHWRIRHVSGPPGIFCFEASADGVTWQTLRRDNAQFPVTALRPELSAGTWQREAAPGMAIFDNFRMERGATEPPPPDNEAPVADPGGPYTGVAGEPIVLTAADSIDFDGTLVSYVWAFADGTTGSGMTITKSFPAGTHLIQLRVTDDLGAFSEETTTATISGGAPNEPPVANTGGPYTGTADIAVAFDARGSSDADGSIATYAWDFGDGSTGTGPTTTHAYSVSGTFTVKLTVTDDLGASHTATTSADIAAAPVNQPPVARPGATYSALVGEAITFDGSASSDTDGSISSYAWRFGDGGTASGSKPVHAYQAAGTYTVTLTVTDNAGATHAANTTATVTARPATTLLSDNFNDNTPDSAKWRLGAILGTIYGGPSAVDPLIEVRERGGRLELLPRTGVSGDHYYGYISNLLDGTGAAVRVQCVQAPGGGTDAMLALSVDSRNFAVIGVEGGYLFFDQTAAGQRDVSVLPFSAPTHRHWRIRHLPANDTIVFETSADGTAWTVQRTSPRRIPLNSIAIELSVGTWQPEAAPGVAIFDDFAAERP